MSELDSSEEQMAATQSAIGKFLSLHLSQTELETLFSSKSLAFNELAQSRSLSEIGMAMIRADALVIAGQTASGSGAKLKKPECIKITDKFCIRIGRNPLLKLSIHQLEE